MAGSFITDDCQYYLDTDEFGTSATYTVFGGAAATINVIFNPEKVTVDPYTGDTLTESANCIARSVDVSAAGHKDLFVIGSDTFEVISAIADEGGITRLELNQTA